MSRPLGLNTKCRAYDSEGSGVLRASGVVAGTQLLYRPVAQQYKNSHHFANCAPSEWSVESPTGNSPPEFLFDEGRNIIEHRRIFTGGARFELAAVPLRGGCLVQTRLPARFSLGGLRIISLGAINRIKPHIFINLANQNASHIKEAKDRN